MSVEAAGTANIAAAALTERVACEKLRSFSGQGARVLLSLVLFDGFLVWLLARSGLFWAALGWAGAGALLQGWRWQLARQPLRVAESAEQRLVQVRRLLGGIGLVRAAIVPLLFALPIADTHYVFTMVTVGLMAGAVGSVAAMPRAYVYWGLPVAVSLAAGWWWQATFEGRWVALFLLLLFAVLAAYVNGSEATLRQLVDFAFQREALAASLRVERDRAEAASQSKTRFFAAASHDLRQPLHALSINATTLELVARKQPDGMIRELSQGINRALAQSNSLLEGLLDISRLDAGAVEASFDAVDVQALLDSVCEEFTPVAAQRGLTLATESSVATSAGWISTDSDLLRRVLNNLVSNALKFTTRGGVVLYARAADLGAVVLGVRDTGCGIAAEEHRHVFEEFYQIGNPSRDRSRGLGLGLSIVQRTAALLGARLTLHSVPDEGTCIELEVPAARMAELPSMQRAAAPEAGRPLPQLNARVLVIDDEPEILQSLAGLLPHLGCEVQCAAGLAQAQHCLDTGFAPQVLVVDFRLRDDTGLNAIAVLRQRLGAVPAVLVTGDTAPYNLQQALASGLRVLHKPLDGGRLALALSAALEPPAPDDRLLRPSSAAPGQVQD